MSDSFIEKAFITLIILFGIFLIILVVCEISSPSCEELGGTKKYVGNQIVLIGKVPVSQPRYKCVVEGNNEHH